MCQHFLYPAVISTDKPITNLLIYFIVQQGYCESCDSW
jgi:hypothetical protein